MRNALMQPSRDPGRPVLLSPFRKVPSEGFQSHSVLSRHCNSTVAQPQAVHCTWTASRDTSYQVQQQPATLQVPTTTVLSTYWVAGSWAGRLLEDS